MKRGGGMGLALLAIGGLGIVWLMKNSAAAKAAGAAAALAPGAADGASSGAVNLELPGSSAPTADDITAGTSFWDVLNPVTPIATGYINFPSGAQAPAASFSNGLTRMDAGGNYFVQWGGQVYELGSMDAQGNWPATPVG
jgi:hypothetical protein